MSFLVAKKQISAGPGRDNAVDLALPSGLQWIGAVHVVIQFVDTEREIPAEKFNIKVLFSVLVEGLDDDLHKTYFGIGSCLVEALDQKQEICCMGYYPRFGRGFADEPQMKAWKVAFHSSEEWAGLVANVWVFPMDDGLFVGLKPGAYTLQSRGELPASGRL